MLKKSAQFWHSALTHKTRIAMFSLGAFLCYQSTAFARYYDYGHADRNREMVINQVENTGDRVIQDHRQTLNDAADRIIDALRNHAGQMSLDTNAAERAATNREDVRDAREVTRRIEDARMNAINSVRGGAASCNMVTGLMGGSALFRNHASAQRHLAAGVNDYLTGASSATRSSRGPGPGREERISNICARYATQAMVNDGVCPAGTPIENRPSEGGPERPSSALDATLLVGPRTSALSPEEQGATNIFLATLVGATPMGALPPNAATTERGRELVALRQASETRLSVATATLGDTQARRLPQASLNEGTVVADPSGGSSPNRVSIRDFMEGTAKRMIGYNPAGGNFPHGVSRQAWDEIRATSFYLDPQFQLRISGQDANQNSKDIAAMMSFQIYLQWEQFIQAERTNVLLASMLAVLDEQNRRASLPQ